MGWGRGPRPAWDGWQRCWEGGLGGLQNFGLRWEATRAVMGKQAVVVVREWRQRTEAAGREELGEVWGGAGKQGLVTAAPTLTPGSGSEIQSHWSHPNLCSNLRRGGGPPRRIGWGNLTLSRNIGILHTEDLTFVAFHKTGPSGNKIISTGSLNPSFSAHQRRSAHLARLLWRSAAQTGTLLRVQYAA